jgi:hypothetical protein
VINMATSLAYNATEFLPLMQSDATKEAMSHHTCRAILVIIEADRRIGGSLYSDSAGKDPFFVMM